MAARTAGLGLPGRFDGSGADDDSCVLERHRDRICSDFANARSVSADPHRSAAEPRAKAQPDPAFRRQSRRVFGSARRNLCGAPPLAVQRQPGLSHHRAAEPSGRRRWKRFDRNPALLLRPRPVRDRLLERRVVEGADHARDLTQMLLTLLCEASDGHRVRRVGCRRKTASSAWPRALPKP